MTAEGRHHQAPQRAAVTVGRLRRLCHRTPPPRATEHRYRTPQPSQPSLPLLDITIVSTRRMFLNFCTCTPPTPKLHSLVLTPSQMPRRPITRSMTQGRRTLNIIPHFAHVRFPRGELWRELLAIYEAEISYLRRLGANVQACRALSGIDFSLFADVDISSFSASHHTHTHARVRTHTHHTYTRTIVHTRVRTNTHTRNTHARARSHTHMRAHTNTLTLVHARVRTNAHAHTHHTHTLAFRVRVGGN